MIEAVIQSIPLLSKLPRSAIKIKPLTGLTNINYAIETPYDKYVLRVPRYGTNQFINREHEAFNTEQINTLKLSPSIVWRQTNKGKYTGVSLTHYLEKADDITQVPKNDYLPKIANQLITLQTSNVLFKGRLDQKKIAEFMSHYFNLCSKNNQILLKSNYLASLKLLGTLDSDHAFVPSHGDLVLENILSQNERIWIIDWEYSTMASPFWDIAVFCNAADLNDNEARKILQLIFQRNDTIDFTFLNDYRFLTRTISDCWRAAFVQIER